MIFEWEYLECHILCALTRISECENKNIKMLVNGLEYLNENA